MSTPPASARSSAPDDSFSAAVITASNDDEQAPSTVYPPPWKSNALQIRPAIVFESPPASVSSVTGAKTDLKHCSIVDANALRRSAGSPLRFAASIKARRTKGQRRRIVLDRVCSPVNVLPRITPVRSRGTDARSCPASSRACLATSSASHWTTSVESNVDLGMRLAAQSNWNPSITAARRP
jgi:hypothetical protein